MMRWMLPRTSRPRPRLRQVFDDHGGSSRKDARVQIRVLLAFRLVDRACRERKRPPPRTRYVDRGGSLRRGVEIGHYGPDPTSPSVNVVASSDCVDFWSTVVPSSAYSLNAVDV